MTLYKNKLTKRVQSLSYFWSLYVQIIWTHSRWRWFDIGLLKRALRLVFTFHNLKILSYKVTPRYFFHSFGAFHQSSSLHMYFITSHYIGASTPLTFFYTSHVWVSTTAFTFNNVRERTNKTVGQQIPVKLKCDYCTHTQYENLFDSFPSSMGHN